MNAEVKKHANQNRLLNEEKAKERRDNQLAYKQMLDQQVDIKNKFKMYGNMSSIEKSLNKGDLHAYKNFDSNQYSLVPGLQHAKHDTPGKLGKGAALKIDSPKSQEIHKMAGQKMDLKKDQLF